MTAPAVHGPALELPVGLSAGLASQPLETTVRLAEAAGRAGVDFVSAGDAGVDTFALLGAVAARTTRIGLMSGIAIWSRSPLTMATAAKTVHNLSGGRFLLGIGPMPRTWGRRADIEVGLMRFCSLDEDRAVAYDRARRSIAKSGAIGFIEHGN